jgi:4-hydroxythreonine-4-phosphate dehydrogenase
MSKENIKVGITIGDFNGIGMEVIIKTFLDRRILENITPIVYGSGQIASFYRKELEINDFSFNIISKAADAQDNKANLIHLWEEEITVEMGKSTETAGMYAFKSLEAATEDLAAGKIDVLVTAPINKKNIQSDKFNFPGHTEYLTKYSNADDSLMLMVLNDLRVGTITNHIPLKDVSGMLTQDLICSKISILQSSLQKDFGIKKPKIAVLGLNPHAGEEGLLGTEEKEVIFPAIEAMQEKGVVVYGPYPSDGFFGSSNFKNFDGILAIYHDQGLTPFKTLVAGAGVNFTAGLPIVRTSPDHGTAYDIAGKGIASEESFRNAVFAAVDIYTNRKNYQEINANPLMAQKRR